ncbi:hypothetical protein MAR_011412 [Mya arenaria]|uniref:Uncharacterized protein n=1 Tax=Mya arenaria TaxID=6604 RepID=A0ABY7FU16_MYAAR|nr:hypothetical protein MAR_011412 [Mya arenaria]
MYTIGSKTVIMDCSSVVIGHSNIIVQNQDNSSEKRERHVDDMTKKLAGLQIVSTILERGNGTLGFSELEEEVGKELKMLGLEYFSKVSGWTLLDFLTLEKDRYKLHRNKKKRINAVTLREIYRKVPTSKMQSRSLEKPSFSEYESTHKTESANNSASRNTTEYMKSLDDKEEWTVVNTQRSGKRSAKPVSEKRNPDVTNDEADLFDSTFLQLPFEDFDPELFKTLISRGEDERTIYVESLNTYETDPLTFCVDITLSLTGWCFLRGRKEIKESRTDLEKDETEESNAWFKKVKETIKTNAKNLDTFLEYRTLTVIILWPENEKFVQFMNKFLTCLQYELTDSPKVLLVKDRNVPKTDEGLTPLKAMANDFGDNFHSFDIPFGEFCAQIARMMKTYGPENGFTLELPCAPDTRQVNTRVAIQEEKAAWLAENLEVLYLNAPFGSNIPDDKKLSEELTLFRKGGTINWSTMYNVNFEKAVIERDAQSQLKRQVQKRLQEFKLSDVPVEQRWPGM